MTDPSSPDDNMITFKLACDALGNFNEAVGELETELLCKQINHKKIWSKLGRSVTFGKPFDFYPRGRVEIRKGKAVIFCSAYLCTEQVRTAVIRAFGLVPKNGINTVKLIADGSAHYRSLMLDE